MVQGWLLSASDRDMSNVARKIGLIIPHGLDGFVRDGRAQVKSA